VLSLVAVKGLNNLTWFHRAMTDPFFSKARVTFLEPLGKHRLVTSRRMRMRVELYRAFAHGATVTDLRKVYAGCYLADGRAGEQVPLR
jgi:hypothetical protein